MLQQQRLNSKGEKYVIGPTGAPLDPVGSAAGEHPAVGDPS